MKTLYLIRHAKSSWANPGLSDIERPLNKRGKRDAPFMGNRLKRYGVCPDTIYSSPAKRAKKTARKIAREVGYPVDAIEYHDDIYTADLMRLLAVIQHADDSIASLFLIGHNYVISDMVEYLTAQPVGDMPTCAIAGIAFGSDHWREVAEGSGTLLFLDYPKKHQSRS